MTAFIRHVHSSSRFDRSPRSLKGAARRYAKRADLITYTEVEAQPREDSLASLSVLGFGTITGDKSYANDCAIQFRIHRFQLVAHGNTSTEAERYANVKGLLRDPAYVTWAVLKDLITGDVLVVAVVHLASSIEGDLAVKRVTKRTMAFLTGFRGTLRIANGLAKKHNADGVMIVADFNLNFKLAWVRALIKTLAPSYRVTWKALAYLPEKAGTHGGRVIDATLMKGRLGTHDGASLMRDDPSSDHRPYRERLFWKTPRPRS